MLSVPADGGAAGGGGGTDNFLPFFPANWGHILLLLLRCRRSIGPQTKANKSASSVTSAAAPVQHLIRRGKVGVGEKGSLDSAETVDDFDGIHGNQSGFLPPPLRLLPLHSTVVHSDKNGDEDPASNDELLAVPAFKIYKKTQPQITIIPKKIPFFKSC